MMAPIKFLASQVHSINQYKNIRMKLMKHCTNNYFNRQHLVLLCLYTVINYLNCYSIMWWLLLSICSFIIFLQNSSTCFGWYPHPSSGAQANCNYNIWHRSNRICYHPLTWRSQNVSSTTANGSKYGSTSARCCNYSLHVLLMMDEGIIRNT